MTQPDNLLACPLLQCDKQVTTQASSKINKRVYTSVARWLDGLYKHWYFKIQFMQNAGNTCLLRTVTRNTYFTL